MNTYFIKTVFNIILVSIPYLGFSQLNEIKIRFIGNCGLYLSDGNTNLYTDFPYKSGAYGYMKYDPIEIDSIKENALFLFTHQHADHYSKKIIKQIQNKHKGSVFGSWNTDELKQNTDFLLHTIRI